MIKTGSVRLFLAGVLLILSAPIQAGQQKYPITEEALANLTTAFVDALATDFEANGAAAIVRIRQDDPVAYLRLVMSIIPKKLNVAGGITLRDYIAALALSARDTDRDFGEDEGVDGDPPPVRH